MKIVNALAYALLFITFVTLGINGAEQNDKIKFLEIQNDLKEKQFIEQNNSLLKRIEVLKESLRQENEKFSKAISELKEKNGDSLKASLKLKQKFEEYKNLYTQIYEKADYVVQLKTEIWVMHKDENGTIHVRESKGQLSGFVINYDGKHYILTAGHIRSPFYVIQKITAYIKYKEEVQEMELLGYDTERDCALLKFKDKKYQYKGRAATLGNSDQLSHGNRLIALGSPLGLIHTITSGILNNKVVLKNIANYKFLLHSAPTNPGSSGGPLLNSKGEVVGINVMAIGSNTNNFVIPMSLAVPINEVKKRLPDLASGINH